MSVTIESGLLALKRGMGAYFASHNVTATVAIGWKQPTRQDNQGQGRANRVVIIPSDPSGRGGKLSAGAVRNPGPRRVDADHDVRALALWERFVVLSVWAVDLADPHDEEKQIEATEDLFEKTIQAVHTFGLADVRWGDVAWTTTPTEHLFGRELRVGLTFRHPMFDSPTGVAYPAPVVTRSDD